LKEKFCIIFLTVLAIDLYIYHIILSIK